MKNLIKLFWLIGLTGLMFTSCQKENIVDMGTETEEPIIEEVIVNPIITRAANNEDGLDFRCFSIETPFGVVDEEGTVYEIISEESIVELFADGDLLIVDFDYPLNIIFENGENTTVEEGEALAAVFAECLPDGGWDENAFPAYLIDETNSCYSLSYPLDLEDLEGEVITIEDEAALADAIASDDYFFVYPITLIDEDGEEIEVRDTDDMFNALISCNGFEIEDTLYDWEIGFEFLGCYELFFPFGLVLQDGQEVTVENHEEYCDLILYGQIEGYDYPLTLINIDGEEVIVNSEDELNVALEECNNILFGGPDLFLLFGGSQPTELGGEPCYDIVYPISAATETGDSYTFENEEALVEFIETSSNSSLLVDYPVTIILTEDGSEVELGSAEENFNLLISCQ